MDSNVELKTFEMINQPHRLDFFKDSFFSPNPQRNDSIKRKYLTFAA